MDRGRIKSYGDGQGVITPDDGSEDVFFLDTVIEGGGDPSVGGAVEFELYPGGGEREAQKVVLL